MMIAVLLSIFFPIYSGTIFHFDGTRETQLFALIVQHPLQQREILQRSPVLDWVAREKARDMAERDYFSHTNPEGIGPNHLVAAAGFPLPDIYRRTIDQNNIESLAGNPPTATRTLQLLIESDGHRPHILGQHPFFSRQNKIGIGVVVCNTCYFRYLWVILIAESEDVSGESDRIEVLGVAPTVPGEDKSPDAVLTLGPTAID